jgi:hypothetical protein
MLAINNFLGNVVKFLEVFRSSIDYYEIDKDSGKFVIDDEEEENYSIGTTLFLLFTIAFSIFFTGLMVVLNIIMFVVNGFIAPYIGKVALYTIKILALITAIILAYYILVKFNKVNTFIDKQYIDFFIKSFQNICKGVS